MKKGLRLSIPLDIILSFDGVGNIDLMKKGLRLRCSSVATCRGYPVGNIDLMKKGLRRCTIIGWYPYRAIYSRKHWPDEKGIATLHLTLLQKLYPLCRKHWPDEKGIATIRKPIRMKNYHATVGNIDLMKKGLRRNVIKVSWFCDIEEIKSERLTWWKRDCDASPCMIFTEPSAIPWSERLTWWKRDCDPSKYLSCQFARIQSRKHWPDEKGIATVVMKAIPENKCHLVGKIDLMKKGLRR